MLSCCCFGSHFFWSGSAHCTFLSVIALIVVPYMNWRIVPQENLHIHDALCEGTAQSLLITRFILSLPMWPLAAKTHFLSTGCFAFCINIILL